MTDQPESNHREDRVVVAGGGSEIDRRADRQRRDNRENRIVVVGTGSEVGRMAARKLLEELGDRVEVVESEKDIPITNAYEGLLSIPGETESILKPEKPVEPWRVKKGRRQRGGYPRYR